MRFLQQTWILTKKDLLLVGRRGWISTLLRALILPVIITFILGYVKILIAMKGSSGVQEPFPILSLQDAFNAGSRSKFVIVDHDLTGADVRAIIDELSSTAQRCGKKVHIVSDPSALRDLCPASNRGITDCFSAVEFWSSPDQASGAIWNYTLHFDTVLDGAFSVNRQRNGIQIYVIPIQHALDSMIASAHGGPGLPQDIQQFGFTASDNIPISEENDLVWLALVEVFIAFCFFVVMCGSAYHLTGHITQQREKGLLKLIDAMMPNENRWQCIAARILASHLTFDLIYAPGWIAMGAITGAFTFSFAGTGLGWYILMYVLTGLALSSYSILVSSFFKREQLGAITAVMIAIGLSLVTQYVEAPYIYDSTLGGIWALSILFPPCTFVNWILLACWTSNLSGTDNYLGITTRLGYPSFDTSLVAGGKLFAAFAFQIVLYPIIGAVIEQYLHGQSSRSRYVRDKEQMSGNAVRLTGVSKSYTTGFFLKRKKVKAVERLDLSLYAGSITILLGTNGSGKTTTLNTIAGLETITEGQIDIDEAGGVGLCPQTNVNWDSMSVEEHVSFFEQLKRPHFTPVQTKSEVDRMIIGCDLELKRHSRAKTLSGGQKRKLQLAMMLAGGSKVCCIDEASSGIDPLARRKIWDILLQERGRRTMLLSTHFLDETEVLSDHVAILSKGLLKAEGSVTSLKNQFGGGYHVILPHPERLDDLENLPKDVSYSQNDKTGVFGVPDTSRLAPVISMLSRAGITDYRIRAPTIEDVFLKLADEMKVEGVDESYLTIPPMIDSDFSDLGTRLGKGPVLPGLNLHTGQGCGPLEQTKILFLKRVTVLKHNYMPYFWALFLPLLLAGVVTRFLRGYQNGIACSSSGFINWFGSLQLAWVSDGVIFGPANDTTKAILERLIPDKPSLYGYYGYGYPDPKPSWQYTTFVNSSRQFHTAVHNAVENANFDTYNWGGSYLGEPNLFTFATENPMYPIFAQGLLDMLLTNMTIGLSFETFETAWDPQDIYQGVVAVFVALGFTVYPGLLALYPTAERLRNVRAMQYSNGILSSSLWLAYALFDLIFIILISVFTTVIWGTSYGTWYALEYVFVVLLLYGMAATLYSYLISLWAKSQLAALACTSLVQSVFSMLFFVGYVGTINAAPVAELDDWFNYIYYTMALFCPGVSLFRALLVSQNVYGLACNGRVKAKYPGGINYFGGPILYLTIQIILFIAILVYSESGRSLEIFGIRKKHDTSIVEEIEPVEEEDIFDDEKHLTLSEKGLRLFNLTKTFGPIRAVENVNLGILPSEKFALLGPNGAGKSTTIALVRGELQPDWTDPQADVWISGDSLTKSPVAAKNHLGVCPQFDAVDAMTITEHLDFYARARGVPNKEENIKELITTLGLAEHANKLVKKLSGGTKRKLSLAIALIANPSVLLLDEPSSGMDPAAKRVLWAILTNISRGRSLLLTTHSMEEAAALCDRAGIMATKMLALGSIADLCAHHGDKIYIHIVHQNAPYTSADDMDRIWMWAKSTFLIAEAERRAFGGQLRFAVPIRQGPRSVIGLADGNDMGRLFRLIEGKKEEMGIRDYSVGPTTLDQVFLNVVSKHDVTEENMEPEKTRWRGISKLLKRKRRGSDLSQWTFTSEDG